MHGHHACSAWYTCNTMLAERIKSTNVLYRCLDQCICCMVKRKTHSPTFLVWGQDFLIWKFSSHSTHTIREVRMQVTKLWSMNCLDHENLWHMSVYTCAKIKCMFILMNIGVIKLNVNIFTGAFIQADHEGSTQSSIWQPCNTSHKSYDCNVYY